MHPLEHSFKWLTPGHLANDVKVQQLQQYLIFTF